MKETSRVYRSLAALTQDPLSAPRLSALSAPLISARALFLARSLALTYFIFVLAIDLGEEIYSIKGEFYIAFFQLTRCHLAGLIGFLIVTLHFNRRFRVDLHYKPSIALTVLQQLLFATSQAFSPIVVLVYWTVVFHTLPKVKAAMLPIVVSTHGVTQLYWLFELAAGRIRTRALNVVVVFAMTFVYMAWAWIYYFISGKRAYDFMDPEHSLFWAISAGLPFVAVVLFMLVHGATRLREHLCPRQPSPKIDFDY